jgi:hypothetical protein
MVKKLSILGTIIGLSSLFFHIRLPIIVNPPMPVSNNPPLRQALSADKLQHFPLTTWKMED